MEISLTVIVTAIVIMVTALVLIGVFTGGMGNFSGTVIPWMNETGRMEICRNACRSSCINFQQPPPAYTVNGEDCSLYFPCDCGEF